MREEGFTPIAVRAASKADETQKREKAESRIHRADSPFSDFLQVAFRFVEAPP
jgi:hypothetical protein